MNKQIWKYELSNIDSQAIKMPIDYEILSIQVQNGVPCIWVLVYPTNDKCNVNIEIIGTGHDIRNECITKQTFIGTYQQNGGSLVFHVFESI